MPVLSYYSPQERMLQLSILVAIYPHACFDDRQPLPNPELGSPSDGLHSPDFIPGFACAKHVVGLAAFLVVFAKKTPLQLQLGILLPDWPEE
jgi:hypothetical protein